MGREGTGFKGVLFGGFKCSRASKKHGTFVTPGLGVFFFWILSFFLLEESLWNHISYICFSSFLSLQGVKGMSITLREHKHLMVKLSFTQEEMPAPR